MDEWIDGWMDRWMDECGRGSTTVGQQTITISRTGGTAQGCFCSSLIWRLVCAAIAAVGASHLGQAVIYEGEIPFVKPFQLLKLLNN